MNAKRIGAGLMALAIATGIGIGVAQASTTTAPGTAISALAKADHGKPDGRGNHGKAVTQQSKQLVKQLGRLADRLERQASHLGDYPAVQEGLTALAGTTRDLVPQVQAATTKVELRVLRQSKGSIIHQAGKLLGTIDDATLADLLPADLLPGDSGV